MTRIKIITAYDTAFSAIGDICAASIRLYAAQHGYDYAILPLPAIDRPAPWAKLPVLLEQLSDAALDFVMWVDADALFVRGDVDIRNEIEDGKDLYVVSHPHVIPEKKGSASTLLAERPNTGVMLIRCCEWSRRMLDALWHMDQFIDHYWWENAALLEYLGLPTQFDRNDNNNHPIADRMVHVKWLSYDWNWIPPPSYRHAGETGSPIIVHFAAFAFDHRLRWMSRLTYRSGPLGQRPSDRVTNTSPDFQADFSIGGGLISQSGYYAMVAQSDGNLVIYYTNGWLGGQSLQPTGTPSPWKALWASNTSNGSNDGSALNYVSFQSDGNLVLYDQSGSPLWAAGSGGLGGTTLVMQDDGNLVIYDAAGSPVWATDTAGRTF